MSAILVTCEGCGAQYMAGMVGSTPWPRHECPTPTLRSLMQDPHATVKLSEEQRAEIGRIQARADANRALIADSRCKRKMWAAVLERTRAVVFGTPPNEARADQD